MSQVDRNNPQRGRASESQYSFMEFQRDFPDDATCLDWLWRERFAPDGHHTHCPKCDHERKFHRVNDRPAYDCDSCGHHIHPLAGTIFHKSATSLQLWFYAMYLMASTRCGVSAKQLERELGVTYKTAWRMFNLIRNELMTDDDEPLSGEVEMDETFMVPRRPRNAAKRKRAADGKSKYTPGWVGKPLVIAAVERKGRLRAKVAPNSRGGIVPATLREFVLPESTVFTDDYTAYRGVNAMGYRHHRINHSANIYVDGNVHTQTIEGFFGLFKNGVRGVYHAVSYKWLQGYLNEYVWRYNRRDSRRAMFFDLLDAAASRAR